MGRWLRKLGKMSILFTLLSAAALFWAINSASRHVVLLIYTKKFNPLEPSIAFALAYLFNQLA